MKEEGEGGRKEKAVRNGGKNRIEVESKEGEKGKGREKIRE